MYHKRNKTAASMAIVELTPTPMPVPRVAALLAVNAEVCACDEAVLDVMSCAGDVMAMDVELVVARPRAYSVPVVVLKLPHPYDEYVGATPAVGSSMRTHF